MLHLNIKNIVPTILLDRDLLSEYKVNILFLISIYHYPLPHSSLIFIQSTSWILVINLYSCMGICYAKLFEAAKSMFKS